MKVLGFCVCVCVLYLIEELNCPGEAIWKHKWIQQKTKKLKDNIHLIRQREREERERERESHKLTLRNILANI